MEQRVKQENSNLYKEQEVLSSNIPGPEKWNYTAGEQPCKNKLRFELSICNEHYYWCSRPSPLAQHFCPDNRRLRYDDSSEISKRDKKEIWDTELGFGWDVNS